jgi:hypothetical protein
MDVIFTLAPLLFPVNVKEDTEMAAPLQETRDNTRAIFNKNFTQMISRHGKWSLAVLNAVSCPQAFNSGPIEMDGLAKSLQQ